MAAENEAKEVRGISFSFSKKKESKTLKEVRKIVLDSNEVEDYGEEKDFIASAEGKELKRFVF